MGFRRLGCPWLGGLAAGGTNRAEGPVCRKAEGPRAGCSSFKYREAADGWRKLRHSARPSDDSLLPAGFMFSSASQMPDDGFPLLVRPYCDRTVFFHTLNLWTAAFESAAFLPTLSSYSWAQYFSWMSIQSSAAARSHPLLAYRASNMQWLTFPFGAEFAKNGCLISPRQRRAGLSVCESL